MSEVKTLNIKDIRILQCMRNSRPSETKISERLFFYQTNNYLPNIKVSYNGEEYTLIDGYTVYLAAKTLHLETINCDVIDHQDRSQKEPGFLKCLKITEDPNMRKKIYDKYNGKCYICGRPVVITPDDKDPMQMTIDHIKPLSKHGSNNESNLACCCQVCNGLKNNFTYSVELKIVILRELRERGLLEPIHKKHK